MIKPLTLVYMNESKIKKKINLPSLFFLGILLLICRSSFGSSLVDSTYKVMFYNVENLFDTEDDPTVLDEEFLPEGERHWDNHKFYLKLKKIFQVIMAAGKGSPPTIIGMSEIENQKVLELLLHTTPLGKMGYKIVHKESPDRRGIDVALLYREDQFHPISYQTFPVVNPDNNDFRTRDILYVKGIIAVDTLHFFVNHWPSKYGGVIETKPLRALAAETLKCITDSLLTQNNNSKIIMMGDFNDSPFDESISKYLGAHSDFDSIKTNLIYNLAFELATEGKGSNKYQGKWELIDQILVSGSMLSKTGIHTSASSFQIFDAPFLLEKDKTYLGEKPFRTYAGFKYNNGFSDHLPVLIELSLPAN